MVGRPCVARTRVPARSPPGAQLPISIWLAKYVAKVGPLLWLGTFIVWIVHGSATTFPNLITGPQNLNRLG